MLARSSLARASSTLATRRVISTPASCVASQQRFQQSHAISNPTLADIERRWEAMPPQEQADLWMALRDRMKKDWNELTLQEKKAAYWIAFGPHGPRAEAPPGETGKIVWYTLIAVAASAVLFGVTRHFARQPPRSMTKEWQEASNEYMKSQNVEPITGISSEGYTGKGALQSKTAKEQGISLEPAE